MDIRDYEYIAAIAEQGNITRAAASLFITQPALTKFLQRTEKKLGVLLFTRNGSQLIMTDAGRRYVETAHHIIELDRTLSNEMARRLAVEKGQIRLGFGMGRSEYMLNEVLPAFYLKFPDIQIFAEAATGRYQMRALESDTLDMGIITGIEHIPGYCYLPMQISHLVLAVANDHPILREAKVVAGYSYPVINIRQMEALTFIRMPQTTNSGNLVQELFRSYNILPKIILEVSDVRSLMDAVAYGLGVAIYLSVPTETERISYLSIEGLKSQEYLTELIYKKNKKITAPMKYLIQLITENKYTNYIVE